MKKAFALLLVLFAVLAGCGIFDDDNKKTPSEPIYPARRYYPLKVGASWTYRVTTTDSLGGQTTFNYINSIIGTVNQNRKNWFVIYNNAEQDTVLAREQGNRIFSLVETGAVAARPIPGIDARQLARMAQATLREVPILDLNASVGEVWTIFSQTDSIPGFVISQEITGTFQGIESITVPRGSFDSCLKYLLVYTSSIRSPVFNGSTSDRITLFLAPDIGPARSVDEYREDGRLVETEVEELTDFLIPQ